MDTKRTGASPPSTLLLLVGETNMVILRVSGESPVFFFFKMWAQQTHYDVETF
jgi:hypothetical protein